MKYPIRSALLFFAVPAVGPGSVFAGGDRMGGTGLSLRQSAGTVMGSMVQAGIGCGRFRVVTRGGTKPRVPDKDAGGMPLNRPVVLSAL